MTDPGKPGQISSSVDETASSSEYTDLEGYCALSDNGEVLPTPREWEKLLPSGTESSFSDARSTAAVSRPSGICHELVLTHQIELLVWGKRIPFTIEEYKRNANNIRSSLWREGALIRSRLESTHDIYSDLRSGLVAKLSNLFSGDSGDPKPLLDLVLDVESVCQSLLGSTIDLEALRAAGEGFQQIKSRESKIAYGLEVATRKAGKRAEATLTALTYTEEISWELLNKANSIYSLGNPIRTALGEIAILSLRASASSLGHYLAFKDRKHVIDNLKAILLERVPPILVDLLLSSLKRSVSKMFGKDENKLHKASIIVIRALVKFQMELVVEALKDKPQLDSERILQILVSTSEDALVQVVSLCMGMDDTDPPPASAKYISYTILAAVFNSFTPIFLKAHEDAKKRNEPLSEVLIAKLPELIMQVFKTLLIEFAGKKMQTRWTGESALKEWQQVKGKAREIMDRLKQSSEPATSGVLTGQAGPLPSRQESKAIRQTASDSQGSLSSTNLVAAEFPTPKPAGRTPPSSKPQDPGFRGMGVTARDLAKTSEGRKVLRELYGELKRTGLPPKKRKEALKDYLSSSRKLDAGEPITIVRPREGTAYYRLVAEDKAKDDEQRQHTYGWWITEEQLSVVRSNPAALKHILLALPPQSWPDPQNGQATDPRELLSERYKVYRVTTKQDAIVFRSEVAPTRHKSDADSATIIQLGGTLRPTEQIIIPNGQHTSESVPTGEFIPGFVQNQDFVRATFSSLTPEEAKLRSVP